MSPRRLYIDNAATSFPKPRSVLDAMTRYATEIGASAGRGGYAEAVETGNLINQCRQRINQLINGQSPDHVIFTLNCSDGLNLAIRGLIDPSESNHAICTHIDHNSILRPLNELASRGWLAQTRVPVDGQTGLVDPEAIRKAIRPETRFIAITHASNVTGTLQPIRLIGAIARERGIPLIVDAAQSIGHTPIDVQADGIDLLAAPGHKALLGPLGTGFLYIRPGLETTLRTCREGGTGSVSELDTQPDFMPDRFETGSQNAIGIIGLSEGVKWLLDRTIDKVAADELDQVRVFLEGISNVEGLSSFGPQGVRHRVGVFSVRIEGLDPQELSSILEIHYGILTRAGIHCAPLAHETIGTRELGGTTRFSFGPFLTKQDIKFATDALAEVAMSHAAV
jgi:cysteine desulfurase family protein